METNRAKSFLLRLGCAFRFCRFYCVFFSYSSNISNIKFQAIKVKYVKYKWMSMVWSHLVSAAEYRFKDLVEDITSCCMTLNYLNEGQTIKTALFRRRR